MPCNSRQLIQHSGAVRPDALYRQAFGCQRGNTRDTAFAFPGLISAQRDTQLFSCLFLRPSHTAPPYLQFETRHKSPYVQKLREHPGRSLSNYAVIAHHDVQRGEHGR